MNIASQLRSLVDAGFFDPAQLLLLALGNVNSQGTDLVVRRWGQGTLDFVRNPGGSWQRVPVAAQLADTPQASWSSAFSGIDFCGRTESVSPPPRA
jgi:hypothetical protein